VVEEVTLGDQKLKGLSLAMGSSLYKIGGGSDGLVGDNNMRFLDLHVHDLP
jgi:hypothetical protein